MTRLATQPGFRADIQGLRAVAILAVVAYHVGLPGAAGGYIGVDVFFVVSGFLITGLLLREFRATRTISLSTFYSRRLRRLLPAALLVIVATMAIATVAVSVLRIPDIALDGAAAAMYVSNLWFAVGAAEYSAAPVAPSPFLHFWSLGIEEQFYLLWPLLILVALRRMSVARLKWLLVFIVFVSFATSVTLTATDSSRAFFLPHTRVWELGVGAALALGLDPLPRGISARGRSIVAAFGLAVIGASVLLFGQTTPFPGPAAAIPVFGAATVIAARTVETGLPGRLLGSAPAQSLGRISYALYLWHWPLLVLIPLGIGHDSVGMRACILLLAVVIAWVSTRYVEEPIREGRLLGLSSNAAVRAGLAGSLALAVALVALPERIILQLNPSLGTLYAVRDGPPLGNCFLSGPGTVTPRSCEYGRRDGLLTLVLFGDSHAAQWQPAIEEIVRTEDWLLVTHIKAGCPAASMEMWDAVQSRAWDDCSSWREAAIRMILDREPDVVLVGGARTHLVVGPAGPTRWPETRSVWEAGLASTVVQLTETGTRVIILAETPILATDPLECIADGRSDEPCRPMRSAVVDAAFAQMEADVARRTGAAIISANDWLCTATECPLLAEGVATFTDQHHASWRFLLSHAPELAETIRAHAGLSS